MEAVIEEILVCGIHTRFVADAAYAVGRLCGLVSAVELAEIVVAFDIGSAYGIALPIVGC